MNDAKVPGPADEHNPPARPRRRYDSARRSEQAASTRRRIVAAAADCFAESGYAGTTMGRIAERAGVSVESVHLQGPKRALLIAAFSQAFTGEETDAALEDGAFAGLLAIEDRDVFLATVADAVLAGQRSGIGVWRAVQAAATTEPEVAELVAGLAERRRRDDLTVSRVLAERGWLADDRPIEQVADTLALLTGFDPYQLYVLDFGWPEEQLRAWFLDVVERMILRPKG